MSNKLNYSRRASLSMKLTEFEVPPMQDLLIIGRGAPIGPEAVRRMAEALSPEQFSILKVDHPKVEAVLLRKSLMEMLDKQQLLEIILGEADRLINESMVLKAELNITISIQREVELQ
ncbi:hypothetical protein GCM10023310_38890 [Paenibacillus vulneris]|uniref:Uncharacterized protein n=1 Tax=Paenibacillus vulneris TaxID=1133364 RepID=A0ABW3ULZ9_9BACL|nr:hypothetical protein [Paenibacillus sp. OAS669]MBE1444909.1 hypothetical protein [Paenibacillus sp. OAS669]